MKRIYIRRGEINKKNKKNRKNTVTCVFSVFNGLEATDHGSLRGYTVEISRLQELHKVVRTSLIRLFR